AVMLLWPPRQEDDLRREASAAMRVVADCLDSDAEEFAERARLARAGVDGLRRRFLSSQHRPTGPTGPTAALASIPDELDWLLSFVRPPIEPTGPEDEEALAAAAGVLRASADRLEGKNVRPDFAALDIARDGVARAVVRRLPD